MVGNWLLNMAPHRFWFSSLADKFAAAIRHSSVSVRYASGVAVALVGILSRILVIPHWTIGALPELASMKI
jgi:hypothetical protein